MNQLLRQMIHQSSPGFLETSTICERKVLVVDFTKVISFVQQLVSWWMPAKHLNMARVMRVMDRWTFCQTGGPGCFDYENVPIFLCSWWRKSFLHSKEYRPGYQALIMVHNSQDHLAYVEDALLASQMNVQPSGKQAWMQNRWFLQVSQKITQLMVFPSDHLTIHISQMSQRNEGHSYWVWFVPVWPSWEMPKMQWQ